MSEVTALNGLATRFEPAATKAAAAAAQTNTRLSANETMGGGARVRRISSME
jgi:hypothetical protein